MKVFVSAGMTDGEKLKELAKLATFIQGCNGVDHVFHPGVDTTIPEDPERESLAYDMTVENLRECDIVVAMPDRQAQGVAWEIGYAAGLGKPVILFVKVHELENNSMMVLHSAFRIVTTLKALGAMMRIAAP